MTSKLDRIKQMFETQSKAPAKKIEQHVTRTVTVKDVKDMKVSKYSFMKKHTSKNDNE